MSFIWEEESYKHSRKFGIICEKFCAPRFIYTHLMCLVADCLGLRFVRTSSLSFDLIVMSYWLVIKLFCYPNNNLCVVPFDFFFNIKHFKEIFFYYDWFLRHKSQYRLVLLLNPLIEEHLAFRFYKKKSEHQNNFLHPC